MGYNLTRKEGKGMTEKEFYIEAGKQVRDLRKSIDMTQEDLSEKTGIARSLIAKFESTGKKISAYRLQQIMQAMGFSIVDLGSFPEKKKGSLYQLRNWIEEGVDFIDRVIDEQEKDALESERRASERSRARTADQHHGQCTDDQHCLEQA